MTLASCPAYMLCTVLALFKAKHGISGDITIKELSEKVKP
jgi:hypothetical protein